MLQRRKTILLHTLFSAAVVSTLLAVVFLVWYPYPFFRISGAGNVLRTLVGVDAVLGPLLTVLLYKPGKKGLWIDMWFIAIVQLGALVYGTTVIYQQRPQFVVFSIDRFAVLPEPDLVHDGGPIAACPQRESPPCLAVAVMPEDTEQRNAVLARALEQGIELEQQPEHWRPLAEAREAVLDKAQPLAELAGLSPRAGRGVARVLERSSRDPATLRWVPVINKRLDAFSLIIDATTAEPVDVVAVDPWEPEA